MKGGQCSVRIPRVWSPNDYLLGCGVCPEDRGRETAFPSIGLATVRHGGATFRGFLARKRRTAVNNARPGRTYVPDAIPSQFPSVRPLKKVFREFPTNLNRGVSQDG
jgi:hypothetical protein